MQTVAQAVRVGIAALAVAQAIEQVSEGAAEQILTADFFAFGIAFLGRVATGIINEVKGIDRMNYDITSKPRGTIEWE